MFLSRYQQSTHSRAVKRTWSFCRACARITLGSLIVTGEILLTFYHLTCSRLCLLARSIMLRCARFIIHTKVWRSKIHFSDDSNKAFQSIVYVCIGHGHRIYFIHVRCISFAIYEIFCDYDQSVNPLAPKSDWHLISPYYITLESNI